jgi:hypothetical protein
MAVFLNTPLLVGSIGGTAGLANFTELLVWRLFLTSVSFWAKA